jgi:hypothetical protein
MQVSLRPAAAARLIASAAAAQGSVDIVRHAHNREESVMSVVVTAVAPFNAEQYDAVTERVMSAGQLPDGCELHIAGPVEGGWRVITVWDEEDTFHRFREKSCFPRSGRYRGRSHRRPSSRR